MAPGVGYLPHSPTAEPRPRAAWPLVASLLVLLLGGVLLQRQHRPQHQSSQRRRLSVLPAELEQELASKAVGWEPQLFASLGTRGTPPQWDAGLATPCVTVDGVRRCVPGLFVIGGWQAGMKKFSEVLKTHPDLAAVGNGACYGTWHDDAGGRKWATAEPPEGFDARTQVLTVGECVSMLTFYPGFAGRFHRWWEVSYWPCKAKCMDDRKCQRTYFDTAVGQMWKCKNAALAAHDQAVALQHAPAAAGAADAAQPPLSSSSSATSGGVDGTAGHTFSTPWLMRQTYGVGRVKLIAMLRSPIDRLEHAFVGHPHYAKRYGRGAEGFHAYVVEQTKGWRACEAAFGTRRCAVHFEQLGPEPNDVFFHCDQLIRGMYAPFVADWLLALPGSLLLLRAEDFFTSDARPAVLQRVWRHLGLRPLSSSSGVAAGGGGGGGGDGGAARRLHKAEGRLPSYDQLTPPRQRNGFAMAANTRAVLAELYAPFNRALVALLRGDAAQTSCAGSECDAFLWETAAVGSVG